MSSLDNSGSPSPAPAAAFLPLYRAPLRDTLIAIAGCLVLLPFTIAEAVLWGGPDFGDWRTWTVWLVLGLVPGIGAYGAYAFCVRELGAGPTSLSLYLAPPYVGLMAWLALGEAPQWYHLLGLLLVLPGLYLATRPAPAKPAAAKA